MLKTNSKKARENIRAYIVNHFDGSNFDIETPDNFKDIACAIYDNFESEKPAIGSYARMSTQDRFNDWCAGLPTILDTCYFYNRSAVDDLGELLEESDSEKAKYTEQDAEKLLTYLIFREINHAVLKG